MCGAFNAFWRRLSKASVDLRTARGSLTSSDAHASVHRAAVGGTGHDLRIGLQQPRMKDHTLRQPFCHVERRHIAEAPVAIFCHGLPDFADPVRAALRW